MVKLLGLHKEIVIIAIYLKIQAKYLVVVGGVILKYKTGMQNTSTGTWQIVKDIFLLGITTIVNSDSSTIST